ncbi:hypothetical protein LEP1GSC079_2117 [Leptospira interrogans str. FPW1039]|uniref:Uncharacterized protein n=1 Tax=Leptospira interrogans str. FPW1039 TaxID=1193040 RepID=A0A0F6I7Y5_LEPIR|nr:hypothetical protein LEP1GSC069_1239 [Leptospira interrogans serovar Canicola str. Fiocruz LV133]EMF31579.1 hypothetical protein LEP1GSC201_1043 [Leptospira interrogans serovar Pomona str. Fox 32256]EMJ34160.1 hypothetical protein LEP1GSC079_2117 [Leptospira interrogans str. FPW1039]EMK18966.1 hypothetical protein LEP1GSC075_1563 [Leptospira interrogans str. Kito]
MVFKKYRKFGIYGILKQNQNIQIFEIILSKYSIHVSE